jgi:uncharacterized protein
VAGAVDNSLPPPRVAWIMSGATVLASAQVADGFRSRLQGLIGRTGFEGAFVIENTKWIHTFGMRFPLDVAYVDTEGTVVRVDRLPANRMGRPEPRAVMVIEAQAGAFERWGLVKGQPVELRR